VPLRSHTYCDDVVVVALFICLVVLLVPAALPFTRGYSLDPTHGVAFGWFVSSCRSAPRHVVIPPLFSPANSRAVCCTTFAVVSRFVRCRCAFSRAAPAYLLGVRRVRAISSRSTRTSFVVLMRFRLFSPASLPPRALAPDDVAFAFVAVRGYLTGALPHRARCAAFYHLYR